MTDQRVLITGAAGEIGRALTPRMSRPGRVLRLLDVVRQTPPPGGEVGTPGSEIVTPGSEIVTASITDPYAMRAACRGADAVIHLGGITVEAPWQDILTVNIDGARCVLEAARREGVSRVVLASSMHAVGFHNRDEAPFAGVPDSLANGLPADATPYPDTYYGVSKVALEALGALYHARFGMDVICLRIGSYRPEPTDPRELATWLSPDDALRLMEACLAADRPGFTTVWGISRNTRRWWSLAEGAMIGYRPRDDAEDYAADIVARHGEPDLAAPRIHYVGGDFCAVPVGESAPSRADAPCDDTRSPGRPSSPDQALSPGKVRPSGEAPGTNGDGTNRDGTNRDGGGDPPQDAATARARA